MTRMDQFRQPAPTPARTKKLSFPDRRDFDIGPAVDAALAELGYRDEPAATMDFDQGQRYLHLLTAINGRAMAEDGIEFVPIDRFYPQDVDLLTHQEEIPAGDMLLLFELAGRYHIDLSHF